MDILDRLLGHDAWTTRQLLLRLQTLSDEQLDCRFPIGHGSLRDTFVHMIWNGEAWTDLICQRPIRPRPGPEANNIARLIERHDAAAAEFATVARRLQAEGRLDELFTDTGDEPPMMKTLGAAIVHLATHSMHHRAQALNIMRHLGMTDLIEGDVLGWERIHRPGGWPRTDRS
jgi:uncharacterized damage-inducible protein DinB